MFSRAQMISAIRDASGRKHGTPTIVAWNELKTEGDPSAQTIINYFGTWNRAMREAGLQPNCDSARWRSIKW